MQRGREGHFIHWNGPKQVLKQYFRRGTVMLWQVGEEGRGISLAASERDCLQEMIYFDFAIGRRSGERGQLVVPN